MATIFLFILSLYLILGGLFAIFFLSKAIYKMDSLVKSSSIAFRLILIPASVLLWPYLLLKIFKRNI